MTITDPNAWGIISWTIFLWGFAAGALVMYLALGLEAVLEKRRKAKRLRKLWVRQNPRAPRIP